MLPAQRRTLYIKQNQALEMLKEKGVVTADIAGSEDDFKLAISIDRTALSPCIAASPTTHPTDSLARSRKFPFNYGKREFDANGIQIRDVAHHLALPKSGHGQLAKLLEKLVDIFMTKEAFLLEIRAAVTKNGELQVSGAQFGFDDAAFTSSKRQEDIHSLRNKAEEVPEEVEAEKDGIVYVKYVPWIMNSKSQKINKALIDWKEKEVSEHLVRLVSHQYYYSIRESANRI